MLNFEKTLIVLRNHVHHEMHNKVKEIKDSRCSVDYNKWLKRLDTQPYKLTNKNSLKVPKVVQPTNKKMLL